MLGESIAVREGLFTDITMKPLSYMVFTVPPKLFLAGKPCITARTSKTGGLLTVSLVFEMTPWLSEFSSTLGAVQGGCVLLVNQHVVRQSVRSSELLLTDGTFEGQNPTFTHNLYGLH